MGELSIKFDINRSQLLKSTFFIEQFLNLIFLRSVLINLIFSNLQFSIIEPLKHEKSNTLFLKVQS